MKFTIEFLPDPKRFSKVDHAKGRNWLVLAHDKNGKVIGGVYEMRDKTPRRELSYYSYVENEGKCPYYQGWRYVSLANASCNLLRRLLTQRRNVLAWEKAGGQL